MLSFLLRASAFQLIFLILLTHGRSLEEFNRCGTGGGSSCNEPNMPQPSSEHDHHSYHPKPSPAWAPSLGRRIFCGSVGGPSCNGPEKKPAEPYHSWHDPNYGPDATPTSISTTSPASFTDTSDLTGCGGAGGSSCNHDTK